MKFSKREEQLKIDYWSLGSRIILWSQLNEIQKVWKQHWLDSLKWSTNHRVMLGQPSYTAKYLSIYMWLKQPLTTWLRRTQNRYLIRHVSISICREKTLNGEQGSKSSSSIFIKSTLTTPKTNIATQVVILDCVWLSWMTLTFQTLFLKISILELCLH